MIQHVPTAPVIGIVGIEGAYGRWLARFFRERMGLEVIGSDPAGPDSLDPAELARRADVLLFSAPIRHTEALIRQYMALAGGSEAGRLWMDVTSIKAGPMAAMLASRAEVVGLHPMSAPPKSPSLKGRVTVVCEGRLQRWRPWLEQLLQALEGEYVLASAEQHDRVMALVQAMVHATHLAQAGVLRECAPGLDGLANVMRFRSASFEMDAAIASRILALNPAIYEDIQFGNPHAGPVLDRLIAELERLRGLVGQGDDAARTAFREQFLSANREAWGDGNLAQGNYRFEQLGYLMADLTQSRVLSVHLPEDRPGSLRRLLHVFEAAGVSLASIHSSRTPSGQVHFRIGFDADCDQAQLDAIGEALEREGIGQRVLVP